MFFNFLYFNFIEELTYSSIFFCRNSPEAAQLRLLSTMWTLWPMVVSFGKKSVQFVDLLGYLSLNSKISEVSALFTCVCMCKCAYVHMW